MECEEVWTLMQKKEAQKLPQETQDAKIGDAYTFMAWRNRESW